MRLEGKVAVVTGAAGGIGRVACRRFAEEGATVVGVDVEHADGVLRCDITSSADVAALADRVRENAGGLDVLFNNAGVILGKPLVETTDEEWARVLDVNLRGAFLTMRALVPLMAGRKGSIVNVSSGLGLVGEAMMSAYCASKGGLVALTKAAAVELAPGIRVNVLCPGVIDTPMPRGVVDSLPGDAGEALFRSWESQHLAGRLGRPEEVVDAAVFLASDESSFVTGAVLPVDSGVTAR